MNKSALYRRLYIHVVSKTAHAVKYKLGASPSNKTFTWKASLQCDRRTITKLTEGVKYWIDVYTDEFGTQHWTAASDTRPTDSVVTTRIDNPMLVFKEPNANPHKDDPVLGPIWEKVLSKRREGSTVVST